MAAKVAKLKHQVHNDINTRTELFKDLSIYVNGYTGKSCGYCNCNYCFPINNILFRPSSTRIETHVC